ncbi:MAG: hypothetical protein RIR53_1604 [Bacteroidota bacterium]|jgi:hypothetical protein
MNIILTSASEIQQQIVGIVRLMIPKVVSATPSVDTVRKGASAGSDSLKDLPQLGPTTAQAASNVHVPDALQVITTMIEMLLPVAFILAASILLWKRMETRKSVELAMIEKGLDPRSNLERNDSTRKFRALRFGTLLLGIGLGLAASLIVLSFWNVPDDYRPLVIWSSMAFSAGLALTIYHIIATSLEKL